MTSRMALLHLQPALDQLHGVEHEGHHAARGRHRERQVEDRERRFLALSAALRLALARPQQLLLEEAVRREEDGVLRHRADERGRQPLVQPEEALRAHGHPQAVERARVPGGHRRAARARGLRLLQHLDRVERVVDQLARKAARRAGDEIDVPRLRGHVDAQAARLVAALQSRDGLQDENDALRERCKQLTATAKLASEPLPEAAPKKRWWSLLRRASRPKTGGRPFGV